MEVCEKFLVSQSFYIGGRAARGIGGLGICSLQYVDTGVCGFSAPAPEMFQSDGFVFTERAEAMKKLASQNLEPS